MGVEDFVHLHLSTAYSAHYGVCWPEQLVEQAAGLGFHTLACTDRDGLYGAIKHIQACQRYGVHPIVGVDLALAGSQRVVVLAEGGCSGRGYHLLCELVTLAHQHGVGTLTTESLCDFLTHRVNELMGPEARGLTLLLGPESTPGQLLAQRQYRAGVHALKWWRERLPAQRLVVEVVCQLSPPGQPYSVGHAVRLWKSATQVGIPAVLSNAVRYAVAAEAATADVLDAARALSSLAHTPQLQPNAQGWLKPAAEMHQIAAELSYHAGYGRHGARTLIQTTLELAGHCVLDPVQDLGWGKPTVPEAHILGLNQPGPEILTQRCWSHYAQRFPQDFQGSKLRGNAAARERSHRLEHELNIINHLGFSNFFLTVAEVCDVIHQQGLRVAARGSGASSLVNYLLGISQVDPMEHALVFERFLSPHRSTLPDIDIDVESAQRHHIYQTIFDHFGAERVCLMSMQNGYQARGALRDAGLALGMDGQDIDQLAKQLWRFPASSFRQAVETMPELEGLRQRFDKAGPGHKQQLDLLIDITERLDRLPRHISMHPCGVILSDSTLLQRTPVQPSGMGLPMSQYDKHDMDPMGFLKLDVLGVRMQSTLAYTLGEIHRVTGHAPVLEELPLDDEATFAMIRTTHTLGCFQIESPGQRELIGKLHPRCFNDLIIDISLYRPGPMQSDMVRPFLEQRHGWAQAEYPHPDLVPILEETCGVVVFHEQVLRIFTQMTGCTLAEADEFRRQLGESGEAEVEAFFRRAALAAGYELAVVDRVWQTLAAFGSFGFCKAHGAAFALPTYYSAWLKTHHPEAFMAALFQHDPGMYPRRLLIAEAKRLGVQLLPIDINASTADFQLEALPDETTDSAEGPRYGIRMALSMVSGMSERELQRLVAHQPYSCLVDVRQRARLSRPSLRKLIRIGALDSLVTGRQVAAGHSVEDQLEVRAKLLAALDDKPQRAIPAEVHGQLAFDTPLLAAAASCPPQSGSTVQPQGAHTLQLEGTPTAQPQGSRNARTQPSGEDLLAAELEILGADLSEHLLDRYRPLLRSWGVRWARELLSLRNRSKVLVAGVRVATQTPPQRNQRRVVFISLDDGSGCVDCVFFDEAQSRSAQVLFQSSLLVVEGYIRRSGEAGVSISAIQAWDLAQLKAQQGP